MHIFIYDKQILSIFGAPLIVTKTQFASLQKCSHRVMVIYLVFEIYCTSCKTSTQHT